MRFKLSKLFLAVTIFAVACAALSVRTYEWTCIIVSITAIVFAISAIKSLALVGSDRISAIAFLAVGCSYLLIPALFPSVQRFLGTNYALAFAYRSFVHLPTYSFFQYVDWSSGTIQPSRNDFVTDVQTFFLIGHCVFSWLFAVLAGWFAGFMYTKRETGK